MSAIRRIDLSTLAIGEPEAATYGRWLNNDATSGVDLDGDRDTLRWDEFLAGADRMQRAYPRDPAVTANIVRLREIFAKQTWQSVVGVDLPAGPSPAGEATAYGGITIERLKTTGTAKLLLPFPTNTGTQSVDLSSCRLILVDDEGKSYRGAIKRSVVDKRDPMRHMMELELDLAKLPPTAHFRWEVKATVTDRPIDLATPVPLDAPLPPETKQWLGSAPMVQTGSPLIRELAAKARLGATSVQELVRNTLQVITDLRATATGPMENDDALTFAQTGAGDCCAHSELFAAMMRINGVPTRIVNGIYRNSGYPINMHYQNEYYVAGKGWVHVEPQGLDIQSPRTQIVQTAALTPEMEQGGTAFEQWAGVIDLTLTPREADPTQQSVKITAGLHMDDASVPGLGFHGAR